MLTPAEIDEIKKNTIYSLLNKDEYRLFIFGSRATGTAQKYSDVDIGIEGKPVPWATMGELREKFENSNLQYIIDLVDFTQTSAKFQQVAKSKVIYI